MVSDPGRSSPSRAWTGTTGAPRWWPGRCATPGWRSSTPGCTRRPSRSWPPRIQEDADAIGLSILSGAHMTQFARVLELLTERGASDIVVFGGGIVPRRTSPSWSDGRGEDLHSGRAHHGDRQLGPVRAGQRRAGQLAASETGPGPGPDTARRLVSTRLPAQTSPATTGQGQPEWTCSSIRRKNCSPSTGFPSRRAGSPPRRKRPGRSRRISPPRARRGSWSRPRSRPAAGARPAASSWPTARTRRRPRPRRSSAWTSRATPCTRSWSRRPATSRRSTTCRILLDRAGRTFLSICSVAGRHGDRGSRAHHPEAVAQIPVNPLDGRGPRPRPPRSSPAGGLPAEAIERRGGAGRAAVGGVHRRGRHPGRGQPAGPDRAGEVKRAGREGHPGRQRGLPAGLTPGSPTRPRPTRSRPGPRPSTSTTSSSRARSASSATAPGWSCPPWTWWPSRRGVRRRSGPPTSWTSAAARRPR